MKKTITALLAVATVAGSLSVTPAMPARRWGPGVAAGLIGGAIVGGAIAASRPYPYYYGPPPAYVGGPAPVRAATGSSSATGTAMPGTFVRSRSAIRKSAYRRVRKPGFGRAFLLCAISPH